MIPENYMKIMNDIRSIYVETGSELFYNIRDFGNDMNEYYPSKDGKLHLKFYYNSVHDLITPEGCHSVLGSRMCGNDSKAMEKLIDRFGLVKEWESDQGMCGEWWVSYLITKQ